MRLFRSLKYISFFFTNILVDIQNCFSIFIECYRHNICTMKYSKFDTTDVSVRVCCYEKNKWMWIFFVLNISFIFVHGCSKNKIMFVNFIISLVSAIICLSLRFESTKYQVLVPRKCDFLKKKMFANICKMDFYLWVKKNIW